LPNMKIPHQPLLSVCGTVLAYDGRTDRQMGRHVMTANTTLV